MNVHKEIHFDKMFKYMVNCMWISKTHPSNPRNLKWFCQYCIGYLLFMITYLLILYCVIYHDIKKKDAVQLCANGVFIVLFNVVTLHHAVFARHRKALLDLINKIQTDYNQAKYFPIEEYNIVLNYAKNGRTINYIWLTIAICFISTYQIKMILTMVYYLIVTGEFKLVHLVDINYPDNLELKKNELPVYLCLYVFYTYYYIYAITMYVAMSPLGPIFILHGCGQLELVKKRIADTYSIINKGFKVQKLKLAAKRLSETYNFLRKTNDTLLMYHEIVFKAVIAILPILAYQFLESAKKGHFRFELLIIIFGASILCNFPCYYSDLLLQKSDEIKLALYACGWENHTQNESHILIQLLMIRVSRPVAMHTLFRNICMDALTDIYRQAYTLFNLLNAVWN